MNLVSNCLNITFLLLLISNSLFLLQAPKYNAACICKVCSVNTSLVFGYLHAMLYKSHSQGPILDWSPIALKLSQRALRVSIDKSTASQILFSEQFVQILSDFNWMTNCLRYQCPNTRHHWTALLCNNMGLCVSRYEDWHGFETRQTQSFQQ